MKGNNEKRRGESMILQRKIKPITEKDRNGKKKAYASFEKRIKRQIE